MATSTSEILPEATLALPGNPAWPDAESSCACSECLALPARRPAVIALADGEAREADRDPFGSYACPFCGGVTPSPQGWAANEASLVRYYAGPGETYQPRPYSDGDARAHQSGGCANPACPVNMTADQLAAWRQHQADAEADRGRQQRLSASLTEAAQRRQRERDEKWAKLSTEARVAGQCVACLAASYWESRPKRIRHRDPASCPLARKYAR